MPAFGKPGQTHEYTYQRLPSEGEIAGAEDASIFKNPAQLLSWIEEQERQLRNLQELERRFIATRDPQLLKDFTSNGKYPVAKLLEPIEGPVALFLNIGDVPKKLIMERNQIAKELFPEIQIREVNTDHGPMLAYVGVTTKTVEAALKLRFEQKSLASNIRKGKDILGGGKVYDVKSYSVSPDQILPLATPTPNMSAKSYNRER